MSLLLQIRERFKKYQTREVITWTVISMGASICSLFLARTLYNYHQKRRRGTSITNDNDDNNNQSSSKDVNHNKTKNNHQSSSKKDNDMNKDATNIHTKGKSEDRKVFLTIRSARSQLVSSRVWRQFEEAAYQIRNNSDDTTTKNLGITVKQLTNGDKLLLYALYKQIVDGNAPTRMVHSRTNWNIMAEKAKYDAWTRMRDIPINAAIDHYVTAVTHFCSISSQQNNQNDVESTTNNNNNNDDDDDDDDEYDDDTITSYSESGDGNVIETMFAPASQSRPEVENGGIDYDPNNNLNNSENNNNNTTSLEVQLLQAAGRNCLQSVQHILSSSLSSSITDDGINTSGVLNVNYSDTTGQSALHLAADRGNTEMVQALITAGGNVNAIDQDGISVLQAAVIAGHVPTCQLLLIHHANPDQSDHDGDTPRSCCDDDLDNIDMIALFSKY